MGTSRPSVIVPERHCKPTVSKAPTYRTSVKPQRARQPTAPLPVWKPPAAGPRVPNPRPRCTDALARGAGCAWRAHPDTRHSQHRLLLRWSRLEPSSRTGHVTTTAAPSSYANHYTRCGHLVAILWPPSYPCIYDFCSHRHPVRISVPQHDNGGMADNDLCSDNRGTMDFWQMTR